MSSSVVGVIRRSTVERQDVISTSRAGNALRWVFPYKTPLLERLSPTIPAQLYSFRRRRWQIKGTKLRPITPIQLQNQRLTVATLNAGGSSPLAVRSRWL